MITVVIPVTNYSEQYLRNISLRSLTMQRFKYFDVLLVSEDGELLFCYKLIYEFRKLLNISYLHINKPAEYANSEERWALGGVYSRNYANKNSANNIIACLDHDDAYLPNHLENAYQILRNDLTTHAVYSKMGMYLGTTGEGKGYLGGPWNEANINSGNYLGHSTMVYRKTDMDYETTATGPADWSLWKKFAAKNLKVHFIDLPTVCAFIKPKGQVHGVDYNYNWHKVSYILDHVFNSIWP